MRSKLHTLFSWLIILLGCIHIYLARCLDSFDTYALWFIGAGFAIVFAGFINLIRAKSSEKMIYTICLITNLLVTILFTVSLVAIQKPQVYIGIVLFGVALICSFKKAQIKFPA